MKEDKVAIFWFRRDLRLEDNAGLYHALKSGFKVVPIFIFDKRILDELPKSDRRLTFIYDEISRLKSELVAIGSDLRVFNSTPFEVFQILLNEGKCVGIFANRDYEPYAIARDKEIYSLFSDHNLFFKAYKDQVIFDRQEILKDDGTPYLVFTPYMKKWKAKLNEFYKRSYPTESYFDQFKKVGAQNMISLESMGFERVDVDIPNRRFVDSIIRTYNQTRDIPARVDGTTRLSVHLRFGTISIRSLVRYAEHLNETYINELIWREFYQMVLYHFPESHLKAIKPAYDQIQWEESEDLFERWKNGTTGIPIVDAGMRELNQTGYMHNRVRMIVASFLTKNLLIDWRRGEAYFAEKLLDYDMAANVGGWQWAAGSGCDAAPYFRVFNPTSQQEKFDPEMKYIKKWVPEYGTSQYPKPIVDLKETRERALIRYKEALQS